MFSFGIVLWEILTGEEPYANMHYGAIIGIDAMLTFMISFLHQHVRLLCLGIEHFCYNFDSCNLESYAVVHLATRRMASGKEPNFCMKTEESCVC